MKINITDKNLCHREKSVRRRGDPALTLFSTGLLRRFTPRSDSNRFFYLRFFIITLLILFSTVSHGATKEAAEKIKELENKVNSQIKLPDIKKGTLKNGIKYYFLSDHDLPITKVVIYIKGGKVYDPKDLSGLTVVSSALMRLGGTSTLDPEALDEKLDSMATSIDITPNKEYLVATLKCRSELFEESFNLFLDLLFSPGLSSERFGLIKMRSLASIRRRQDSPEALANMGFLGLMYGKDNPWGNYPTTESINKITLNDVKNYHKSFIRPEHMILGASGDLKKSKLLKLLKDYSNYPTEQKVAIKEPAAKPKPVTGVHIVDKKLKQVVVNMGHLGSFRKNPDKFALILMNNILGDPGTLKTKLADTIRVKNGLAYTVWSRFGFGPEIAEAPFKIFMATKTETINDALNLTIEQISKMKKGIDVSEDDLDRAKSSILNVLVFNYETAFDIISNLVHFSYFGYPDNYIEEYAKNIAKVSLDDIKRVALKYLHPDNVQIVLVGDSDKLKVKLNKSFKSNNITIDK